jgi:hypothetical protein
MIVHFVEIFGIAKTLFSEHKQTNTQTNKQTNKQAIYATNIRTFDDRNTKNENKRRKFI